MSKIPIFLETYNWLQTLDNWVKTAPEDRRPQWSLSSFAKTSFSVRLTWWQDNQLYNIEKAAPSPQEATHRALEEFGNTQFKW